MSILCDLFLPIVLSLQAEPPRYWTRSDARQAGAGRPRQGEGGTETDQSFRR